MRRALQYAAAGAIRAIQMRGHSYALEVRARVNAVVLSEQRHSTTSRLSSALPAPVHGCAPSVAVQREEQVVEDEERGNSASALRTCMLKQRACATVGRSFDAIDSNAVDRTVRFTLAGDCDEDRPSTARAAGLQRPGRNSRHRSGRADWHQQLTTTWRGDDCSRSASSSCSAH